MQKITTMNNNGDVMSIAPVDSGTFAIGRNARAVAHHGRGAATTTNWSSLPRRWNGSARPMASATRRFHRISHQKIPEFYEIVCLAGLLRARSVHERLQGWLPG
ncbi:hypothetical protein GCM10009540_55530 [Streptomyces turgidiscabies]